MSDFNDRPFVAGHITGLRAFRIDTLGRLTGVVHKDVWTPGENAAACHKAAPADFNLDDLYTAYAMISPRRPRGSNYYTASRTDKKKMLRPSERPGHVMAGQGCECGFYAYFDGGNDYLTESSSPAWTITFGPSDNDNAPRVGGVVRGWGIVTVGSRGFRAEKSEVLALVAPDSQKARHAVAFGKVQRNYPGLPVFASEVEAVDAFPLSDPFPSTPEDDDFWTRSV